jgi:Mor family transcriptional regulator
MPKATGSQSDLQWLDRIEIADLLSGDAELVHKFCGKEVLKSLWANFPSMEIYMSMKPLNEAKKRYIRKYFTGANVKNLCMTLRVSESFVYKVIEADHGKAMGGRRDGE